MSPLASFRTPTLPFRNSSCVKMVFWPASLHLDSLQRVVPSWFKPQNAANARFLVYGIVLGLSFSVTATSFALYLQEKRQRRILASSKSRPIQLRSDEITQGVTGLIGWLVYPGSRLGHSLTCCRRKHAFDEDKLPE